MSCFKTFLRILFLLVMAAFVFGIVETIKYWQTIQQACATPTQIFFILSCCYGLLLFIFYLIETFKQAPRWFDSKVIVFFLLPLASCTFAIGAIWGYLNYTHPMTSCSSYQICMIGVSGFLLIKIIIFSHALLKTTQDSEQNQEQRIIQQDLENEGMLDQRFQRYREFVYPLLDSNNNPSPGLSVPEVERLSIKPYELRRNSETAKRQETCTICMENFRAEELIIALPTCKHLFHKKCGEEWLQKSLHCPVCRSDVKKNLSQVSGNESAFRSVIL